MVIYFWDDPEAHLREVYRLLKPGSKFFTGLRTKSSMRQFPFVDYGFILYDPEEWILLIEKCGFQYLNLDKKPDPLIEEEDKTIVLESVCISAGKE